MVLAMPGTEESLYYGKPAIKRDGRIMFSYGDEDVVAIKLDWDSKLRFIEERPEAFSVTPHLSTWPWVLVQLSKLGMDEGSELARLCWEDAPKKSVLRKELRLEE